MYSDACITLNKLGHCWYYPLLVKFAFDIALQDGSIFAQGSTFSMDLTSLLTPLLCKLGVWPRYTELSASSITFQLTRTIPRVECELRRISIFSMLIHSPRKLLAPDRSFRQASISFKFLNQYYMYISGESSVVQVSTIYWNTF